jgi:hypothetical protein
MSETAGAFSALGIPRPRSLISAAAPAEPPDSVAVRAARRAARRGKSGCSIRTRIRTRGRRNAARVHHAWLSLGCQAPDLRGLFGLATRTDDTMISGRCVRTLERMTPASRKSSNQAGFRPRRWRDPDSNRGHHDFQSCGGNSRTVLKSLEASGFLGGEREPGHFALCGLLPPVREVSGTSSPGGQSAGGRWSDVPLGVMGLATRSGARGGGGGGSR